MVSEPSDQITTLITGARIVDGTGNPWFYGDVAIAVDRISAIAPQGSIDPNRAGEVVDANGLVVCPGFIDIQSHSIIPFLTDRRSLSKATQGVTTEIMGEDWTPAPFGGRIATPFEEGARRRVGAAFDEWLERARGWTRFGDWLSDLEARGVSVNVGSFLGGSTVREYGKGYDLGEATPAELEVMRGVIAEAMEDGAFGLATALIYPPGAFAGTEELVSLCEVVAAARGVHITHIRSEEDRLLEALDEAIHIARRTGVATEIYHLKAAGERNWQKMPAAIAMIDAARAEGLDVGADMYPYEAAGTGLTACVPPWASADGRLYDNLRDPTMRERIKKAMLEPVPDWENFAAIAGPENILIASLGRPEHKQYEGLRLSEIAGARGQDWVDAALDLLAAEGQDIFTFYVMMSDENIQLQLRQPWMKIGTDAGGVDPTWARSLGLAHPRAYGSYPRILGRYVRDLGALPLEDAVRKMSSAVADRLGLRDRGLLRTGMMADVVVFDSSTVTDHATYDDPHRLSTGVLHVWVNGVQVLRDGQHTGALSGRRVYGPGARSTQEWLGHPAK
ncbi:MAG: N-acyl-D-amino-acid deacylase [Thermomicrobiales bacterium]|nr:N-acyl-D-amino-acid deacylase [Thermomicrobiales bacterium]